MYILVNPSFTIWKWGSRGSKLYRHVFVISHPNKRHIVHDTGTWISRAHIYNYSRPNSLFSDKNKAKLSRNSEWASEFWQIFKKTRHAGISKMENLSLLIGQLYMYCWNIHRQNIWLKFHEKSFNLFASVNDKIIEPYCVCVYYWDYKMRSLQNAIIWELLRIWEVFKRKEKWWSEDYTSSVDCWCEQQKLWSDDSQNSLYCPWVQQKLWSDGSEKSVYCSWKQQNQIRRYLKLCWFVLRSFANSKGSRSSTEYFL